MTMLYANGVARTPTGLKVAPQSYASLEQIAEDVRGTFPRTPGEPHRLDCMRMLEQMLPNAGFNFKIVEICELAECAAFTIPELRVVVLREDIYELAVDEQVFGRSTIVHEAAHIVLNHAVTLHRGAELGKHETYEDSEWQAKALTAALMMPLEACKIATSAEHLSVMCGTSVQASSYRLERLTRYGLLPRKANDGK